MTKWEARTMFQSIGKGTVFAVVETPQAVGELSEPEAGDAFWTIDGKDKWMEGKITAAQSGKIVVEMKSGTTLVLAPVTSDMVGSGIVHKGMYAEDWFVTEIETKPPVTV